MREQEINRHTQNHKDTDICTHTHIDRERHNNKTYPQTQRQPKKHAYLNVNIRKNTHRTTCVYLHPHKQI